MKSSRKASYRKHSSRNLLDVMKDLDIPEIKQEHGQLLDTAQQGPVPMAAAENQAPDDEERKEHKLSIISERVSEDDSWADQSKIRQIVEGSSRFYASISCSNASEPRDLKYSCKSVAASTAQKASMQELGREFAATMPKSLTEKLEAAKKKAALMYLQKVKFVNEIPARKPEL